MAGAGYKLFTTGEVLTAAQVNTYLQEQTVMSFADSAARTSALSGVLAEGMMSYLRDTNAVQVYNGSAWVSVGGSSPLTTKGDLYGFSTLDARIPIGTNNQVLTADSAQALGLKWATPSSPAFKGCSLQLTSSVGVSNGTQTVVDFTTELFDTDAFHDNSTNPSRITAPAGLAGKYLMIGSSGWANATSATDRGIRITKNGSGSGLPQVNWQTSSSGVAYNNISTIVNLSVSDYCEVSVIQYNGASLTLQSATTFFQAIYLGA